MAARTGNLPQLGVTLLSGVLAEQLLSRAPGSVGAMIPANTGTEAVEAAIKVARAATGRPRVLYAEHAFHGLTLGSLSLNGNAEFRDGFGPLLAGCDPVAFGDLEPLERRACARGRGGFRRRAGAGQGRQPAAGGLSAGRPSGCAARPARCSSAMRFRPASVAPGGFSRSSTGSSSPTCLPRQGPVRRARADRRRARLARGIRQGVRRDGAGGAPRVDVRRQRSRRGGRRWPRCACSTARASWPTPSEWARCCSS